MSPRHFHKTYQSPYFQSDRYRETPSGQCEEKLSLKWINTKSRILRLFTSAKMIVKRHKSKP